jgi:hypothetical protein
VSLIGHSFRQHPFFIFFAILGFELRAYTSSHSTSLFFLKGFFKTGSLQRFAQAGYKPQSS